MMKITAERLRELLHYDPNTGLFTHRIGRKGRGTGAGMPAGRIRAHDGRCRIGVDGERHFANQLAWLYMTGEWAPNHIDHINCDQSDDRFANLRPATSSENLANSRKATHNSSGFKGVNWHAKAGKWRAYIKKHGKSMHIGYFPSAVDAHAAYIAKAKELSGEFARAA